MSAPTIAEFYAYAHIGNRFGILPNSEFYGPTGHRGVDVKGWAGGTIIPSFINGTIITREYQSGLGNCIVVRSPLGIFYGFCHLQTLPLYNYIGDAISWGDPIGPLGSTGSLSDGNHVHITKSGTSRFPWTGPVVDPYPDIYNAWLTARNSTAGDGSTPIDNTPPLQGDKMTTYARRASDGLIIAVPEGGKVYNFGTIEEYDQWRLSIVPTLNGERAANGSPLLVRPPRATGPEGTDKIVSLSDSAINLLITASGAHS